MLAEFIPTERTFTVAGRDWKVPRLGFVQFNTELETYIFEKMSERLAILTKNASNEVAEQFRQQAYDQCMIGIPTHMAYAWTASASGFARSFWIAVKKTNDVTYEYICDLLNHLLPQDLVQAREAIDFAWWITANPSNGAFGTEAVPETNQTPQDEIPMKNGSQSSGKASSGGSSERETGRLSKSPA